MNEQGEPFITPDSSERKPVELTPPEQRIILSAGWIAIQQYPPVPMGFVPGSSEAYTNDQSHIRAA